MTTGVIKLVRVEMGLSPVVHSRSIEPRMAAGFADVREVKVFGESTPDTKKRGGRAVAIFLRPLSGWASMVMRLVDTHFGPVLGVHCAFTPLPSILAH